MKKLMKSTLRSLGLEVMRTRNFQPPAYAKIIDAIGTTVVFDVGANVGQFSMSLRRAGYKGKIVSFEPTLDAYNELLGHSANDRSWYVHARAAVGAEAGTTQINISGNKAQSSSILDMGALHKESAPSSVYVGVEDVSLITIDAIFSSYMQPEDIAFLKIDVQGYEDEVLQGASESIEKISGIKLELSLASLYEGDKLYQHYFSKLEEMGFELWDVEAGHRHRNGRLLQFDAIYVRCNTNA